MDNSELFKNLENVLKEHSSKTKLLNSIRRILFQKEPEYKQILYLVVPELQNRLENVFDRIIGHYIRSKNEYEFLYEEAVMRALKSRMEVGEVCHFVIFNLGFNEKRKLIYKLFKLSKATWETIDKLNEIRNAMAHRYDENHPRFIYKENNILHHYPSLKEFLDDCFIVINEILDIETNLIDAINMAKKEFDF